MFIRMRGFVAFIGCSLFIVACQPISQVTSESSVALESEVELPSSVVKESIAENSTETVEAELPVLPANTPLSPTPTEVLAEGPERSAILKILEAVARTNRAEQRAPTFRGTAVPEPTINSEEVRELADYLPVLGEAPEILNETWINTDVPLRLEDLEGQVVLIEFWTFG